MLFRKNYIALYAVMLSALGGVPAIAQQSSKDNVHIIERNKRDNTPASIVFESAAYKSADASAVLKQYLEPGANDELRFRVADKATADIRIERYDQYYKGIKVEHGNYIIALKNGTMSYMSGNFYRTANNMVSNPVVDEAGALSKAIAYTGAEKYTWDGANTARPSGTLVYIEDYFSGDEPDGKLHLAWRFDVYATKPLSRNNVYVDAVTGRILFADALLKHVAASGPSKYSGTVNFEADLTGGTYSLHDLSRGSGIHTYDLAESTDPNFANEVTSVSNVFASSVALDAHWGAEKVYDYWQSKHSRLSYDGANGELNSFVQYDEDYDNAFWSGSAMFYGNGRGRSAGGFDPLTSLDVCAHEIGHGVCQTTASLIYNRESGAMNEGFSDIWGASVEYFADPHETDAMPKNTWLIGEEIGNNPLRSMSNPKLYGDPDTYGGTYWKNASSSCSPNSGNDNCGVHSNSGVLNKWFFLLAAGGSGTNDFGRGYAVTGLGMDTASIIAYGAELSLPPNANFAKCRLESINFATAQFGACSRQVENVIRAWYAVGVDTVGYTPCTSQISFSGPTVGVAEDAGMNACPASHIVNIPVKLNGPAPTGGNAVATITVTGGTAVSGVDYLFTANTVTFPAGSTAVQYLPVTVYDNGNVLDTGRYFDLQMTITPNGSTATPASVLMQTRVVIQNNDEAPALGGTEIRVLGTSNVTGNNTSPFISGFNQARIQYIVTAAELLAAGIKPNATLTKLGFVVIQKNSTQPFTNYTVKMGHTAQNAVSTAFIAGLTPVYTGNYTTTMGVNTITFTNGFTWNGTSNLVVEICFGNTSRASSNDLVSSYTAGNLSTAFANNNLTSGGCALPFISNNVSNARPVMRFTQDVRPTPIETAAAGTRTWAVGPRKQAYFYSDADTQLIAGLTSGVSDLGCVTTIVSGSGNGFTPAVFAAVNRSVKEITITPSMNDTAVNTTVIYFADSELNGLSPANLYLIKTTAPTDADISYGNTQIIQSPVVIPGANYKGFRSNFTGFGRYFLTNGAPTLAVGNVPGGTGLYVMNNPFHGDIILSADLQKNETAGISLYDVTGKMVYREGRALQGGKSTTIIPVATLNLAAGSYVLQVVYSGGVYTRQLIKE